MAVSELLGVLRLCKQQRERVDRALSKQKLDYPDPKLSTALVQLANVVGRLVKETRQVEKMRRGEEQTPEEIESLLVALGWLPPGVADLFVESARGARSAKAKAAMDTLPSDWGTEREDES